MSDLEHPPQDDKRRCRRRLLVFGSCGLDRLLTVPRYPTAETKVRTMDYQQVGGGNAANAAHAAALLLQPQSSSSSSSAQQQTRRRRRSHCRVQLGTKIGSDAVGQSILDELEHQAGVDCRHGLFQVVPGTTTAFTTVIVSACEHTRTCLHTPGTCGEWSLHEVKELHENKNGKVPTGLTGSHISWDEVCHFHSDSRHTDAALYLALQAKQRQIPISLDVEKDRGTTALDELLGLADIVFTNALQIDGYLQRLTREWEATTQKRWPIPDDPTIVNRTTLGAPLVDVLVQALRPSTYFTRRYRQVGKQVVVTKGDQGSIHVHCESIDVTAIGDQDDQKNQEPEHTITLEIHEECRDSDDQDNLTSFRVCQVFRECCRETSTTLCFCAIYTLRAVGILPNVAVVDTTGAGDAFVGGYLAALQLLDDTGEKMMLFPRVLDRLRFATWVAGQKIQGPGARTTLPSALQLYEQLGGNDPSAVLRDMITPFVDKTEAGPNVKGS